jgi:starch synthase (maltosyl-transferring)
MAARTGSIYIEAVEPQLDGGRHAVKRIAGESVQIRADLFKEGHDALAAVVRWRAVSPKEGEWREVPMRTLGNDAWAAEVVLPHPGRYVYAIEAWPEGYRSWASELSRKVAVGRDVTSELLEGAALLEQSAQRAQSISAPDAEKLRAVRKAILSGPKETAVSAALDTAIVEIASRHPDRTLAVRSDMEIPIMVERPRARFSTWYELFTRSAVGDGKTHGTFSDVEKQLPRLAELGFDVLYLPPIHPIGRTSRKGKNNALTCTPDDVGSPWAIGAAEGGHDAIHPQLGTPADFRKLVKTAASHGIEIALDLAFQCAPDHPYLKAHPEWFNHRPDGTIKTAENPPKRYEDIVNFDWSGPGRDTLWPELKRVVEHWIGEGVKIFRVDNPHTKPISFWNWLISGVHEKHPDTIFLSEAFTRPKVMQALAKVGFTQSYTYFTWRNFKHELESYLKEITQPPVAEYFRGNLWPNTPDILPELLQRGGPPAFRIRIALAATLSSSYGIYNGYEVADARPLHGEEYLDSEKYQLKAWSLDGPGSLRPYIGQLNKIRREHPALQLYRNLRFYHCDNDQVLYYGKATPDLSDRLLIAVSLDPHAPQSTVIDVPLSEWEIGPDESYQVFELLSGRRALWQGPRAQVQLTPEEPAAIFQLLRFARRENAFDYFQ